VFKGLVDGGGRSFKKMNLLTDEEEKIINDFDFVLENYNGLISQPFTN